MNVTLEKLNIPPGSDGSCVDYFRVFNGTELREENALFPPLCGDTVPTVPIFITELDKVLIEFKGTRGGSPGQGIWAGYHRIEPGKPGEILDRRSVPNEDSVDLVTSLSSESSSTFPKFIFPALVISLIYK